MDSQTQKRFKVWQWRTIIVTMLGYAFFYFVRKNFSFAMPGLAAEYGISNTSFGLILAIVGLIYGFSRFFNGILADRINARYHMSLGLLLCALASIAFGFVPQLLGIEIGVAPHSLVVAFAILLVLNNIFQGSGFPPCARLLSHWIPPQELATKMSIWNTSHSIGASVLAILCGFIMVTMGTNISNDNEAVEKITYNYVSKNFKDDVKKSSHHIAKIDSIEIVEQENNGYLVYVDYTYRSNYEEGKSVRTEYNFSHDNFLAVQKAMEGKKDIGATELAAKCNIPEPQAKALQSIVSRSEHTGAWRWCFWIPGIIALVSAFGLFIFLRDTPKSVGLPELEMTKTALDNESNNDPASCRAYVRKMVYKNPIIWILSTAYFFVYIVRFSVLDWGPKFLIEARNMTFEEAAYAVSAFEIMAIVGTLVAGWVTDKIFDGKAHRTCLWCMVGTALFMTIFYFLPNDSEPMILICVLAMAGFFIYGPQALIGIAAANHATKKAAATANGLVGIFGYLSVFVSGLGVGVLVDHFGWNYVFIGMIAMAVIGAIIFLAIWNVGRDGYDRANS